MRLYAGGIKICEKKSRIFDYLSIEDLSMLTINFVLAGILVASILSVCGLGFLNWRRFKTNKQTAKDLNTLLQSTMEVISNQRDGIAASSKLKSRKTKGLTLEDFYKSGVGVSGDLESPEMLSTILTVIIHKYGTAHISLSDFLKVPDEEYISVYVDTASKDLILSMDHDMGSKNPLNLVSFSNPDDNTFH
jgi:hypothetical protein